jgi:hypothetical protein
MASRKPVSKRQVHPDARSAKTNKGFTGVRYLGDRVAEEFLPELRGIRGMKTLKEMQDNDPIIGAVLFAISMLIRQCEWDVTAASTSNEHMRHAEAIRSMLDDMSTTWSDILAEILSMLPYGWSYLEVTYKKRNGYTHSDDPMSSKYSDGFLGWQNFAIRGQDTLDKWIRDDRRRVIGWEQRDQDGNRAILSLSRGMLFRTTSHKDNPEGRSILRNSYRPWYFKKRLEEIEAIGIERDLNGVPVMTCPEGVDIWNADDAEGQQYLKLATTVVRNLRRDEQEGIVKPFGWELELLSSGSSRSIDTTAVIGRYNNAIAMTCLADFIVLGHNNRYGSKALAGNKTAMFQHSITGWGMAISDVLNRVALTKLYAINGWPMDTMATIKPKGLNLPDLEALSVFLRNLNSAGFKMFPNEPLEKSLLRLSMLPSEGLTLGQEMPHVPADSDARADRTDDGRDSESSDEE